MEIKELLIRVVTDRLQISFCLKPDTVAEDVVIYVCQSLKIKPVTRHLFGLQFKKNWIALNLKLWDTPYQTLDFRLRFKVPNFEKLRSMDINAFNYYFSQVREDVLGNKVSDICLDKHKNELIGLGVTDMYRDILENNNTQSYVLNNYKKYIPKDVLRSHFFFLKKPMEAHLSLIMKKGVTDVSYIKSGYLEEFEGIAPNYLIEEHNAWIIESDVTKAICIKVDPFHADMPGILYKINDKSEWVYISSIEDLCFISLRSDAAGSIEVSRKTGIPLYIMFDCLASSLSFVSLLDGYYRLIVKWAFNLCRDLITPSLMKLKKMKCHGPVGGEFSYAKLEEKRNNKPGCYILREDELSFNNYHIDVCLAGSLKPVTYSIISKKDGTYWFNLDNKNYKSVQAIIENYNSSSLHPILLECIPASEYEESNLLLCRPSTPKTNSHLTLKSGENGYGPTQCIHLKNLQIFRGKIIEGSQGFTQIYRCFWKKNNKTKVEVALKALKPIYHEHYLKDFLKLASDWGLLHSSSFVTLLGVTLADPLAMVMEYFPLGPLDKYLQNNKLMVKEVDLVEAATYLANALWLIEEEGLVHGYVKCKKILVASHSENSFCVRLSDPGLRESCKDSDFHWIPPEYFFIPDAARRNTGADMWAFGTTLWEIFSYGDKPSLPVIKDSTRTDIQKYYKNGNRLLCPKNCPQDVYNLMIECWHVDPALRKRPQAAKRDINQLLYKVFNSRLRHSYATIAPAHKSKSSSCDTLNDVCSEALDDSSMRSLSTQLSSLSLFDDISNIHQGVIETEPFHSDIVFDKMLNNYGVSTDASVFSNFDFSTTTTSLCGVSSLQSIFELNEDVNVVLQGKIGQGFYGEVYKGLIEDINSPNEPQSVAVKRLRVVDDNSSWLADFEREIDIMKRLKHPNIVEMKGVILEPEVNLFMEYVEHGSLKCYLNINKERLHPIVHILKYALDVATGMEYLGKMKIVHRDLAARNVLVADEFNVKISDFGLAQFIGSSNYYISQSNRELPIKWFALESLKYGKFSPQSDVWSYGVTLYEMFSFGEEPIIECVKESSSLLDALERGIRLPQPKACPTDVYAQLMAPCWKREGKERPSFSEIIYIVNNLRESNIPCLSQNLITHNIS